MKRTSRTPLELLLLLAVAVLAACSSASKVPPSQRDPFYLYQMGINHFQQGHLQEAERFLRDSLKYDAKNAAAHNYLGLTLLLQGRLPEAEAGFRRALEINNSFADAHNNLGVTYLQMGELAKASQELGIARQDTVYSTNPSVWLNLGLVEMRKGAPGDAVAFYNEALSRDKDYVIAHFHRAQAYEQMGQLDDAAEDYRRFTEVQKDDPEALLLYGKCLMNLKRFDEARPLLERVRFLTPSGPHGQEAVRLLAILP